MPNSIISNKPIIYQFGSHIQYLFVESATSTAFICCKAIFATKAFNFDCQHTIYITTIVIIIVINATVKRSTSTKELLRKEPNLELFITSSISCCPFLSRISLLFLYLGHKIFQCLWGAKQFGVKFKNLY